MVKRRSAARANRPALAEARPAAGQSATVLLEAAGMGKSLLMRELPTTPRRAPTSCPAAATPSAVTPYAGAHLEHLFVRGERAGGMARAAV
jgi:hypothetical protein